MEKILITGANGQLGNEIKKLSENYKDFNFVYTDVNDLDITNPLACKQFFNEIKPQFVINCAAYTAVDKAESDADNAYRINATAVKNLVEACLQCNSYFVQISTDYVFNGESHLPYKETHPVSPASVYGKTKEQGEQEALKYDKSIVIRTSWLYSTFGNNFVKTMLRLGSEKESLNVIFDQIGTPTYAEDLAATILTIADKVLNGKNEFIPGIYHYSNEGVCSWYDFAYTIMKLKELECQVNPIETKDYPTPAKRPFYSVLNKVKIKSTYGIEINHWTSSLKKMLNSI